MKTQRFAIGMTVFNVFVLMSILFRAHSAVSPEIAPVLRGRALEIVDDQGLPTWLGNKVRPDQTAGFDLQQYQDSGEGLTLP